MASLKCKKAVGKRSANLQTQLGITGSWLSESRIACFVLDVLPHQMPSEVRLMKGIVLLHA